MTPVVPAGDVVLFCALLLAFYLGEGVVRVPPGTAAFGGTLLGGDVRRLPVLFPRGADRGGFALSMVGPATYTVVPSRRSFHHPPEVPTDPEGDAVRAAADAAADVGAARKAFEGFIDNTRDVALLSTLAFGNLFVAFPVLTLMGGAARVWPFLAAVHVVVAGLCAWRVIAHHRTLYPDDAYGERWAKAVQILLFPPAAPRALEMLSVHLLDPWHPLAAGTALLTGRSRREYLRRHGPRWLLPAREADATPAYGDALRRGLERAGVSVESALSPPDRHDGAARYCPRCWNQYAEPVVTCPDCGEEPLRAFPEDPGIPGERS